MNNNSEENNNLFYERPIDCRKSNWKPGNYCTAFIIAQDEGRIFQCPEECEFLRK